MIAHKISRIDTEREREKARASCIMHVPSTRLTRKLTAVASVPPFVAWLPLPLFPKRFPKRYF